MIRKVGTRSLVAKGRWTDPSYPSDQLPAVLSERKTHTSLNSSFANCPVVFFNCQLIVLAYRRTFDIILRINGQYMAD